MPRVPAGRAERPAVPASREASGGGTAEEGAGTGLLFAAYLVLVVVEYTGLKDDIAIIEATRLTTLLSYGLLVAVLAKFGTSRILPVTQTKILVGFVVFTAASVMWATVKSYSFNSIRPIVDCLVFMIITAQLVDRRSRFDKLAGAFACVVTFLVIRNFDRLSSASRTRGMLAGYFMGDGNDFAWTMVVVLPIILVLVLGRRSLLTRALGLMGCAAAIFAVVGTQSRGGTIGMGAALFFGWLFVSTRKALGAVAVAVVVVVGALVAPSGYLERMSTINQYEEDSSAQGRLQMWGASIRMAFDYPLGVAAGNFSSVYGRYYMPDAANNRIGWAPNRWLSAHSIYFKVLGEYGFLGLAMLLWLIGANARDNVRSARTAAADGEASVSPHWPWLLNMSLVGYAVSGIFLGGVIYPHQYLLTGLTLSTRWLVEGKRVAAAVAPMPAAHRSLTAVRSKPDPVGRFKHPRRA